ncbi:MAG: phage tail protein [Prosthecobacter sp.]
MPIVGEIILFAGPYTPEGFLPCDGRSLSIQDNQALYSVIGGTYGSVDKSHFSLPDLRSRGPIGLNVNTQLQGRAASSLGESGGTDRPVSNIILTAENLPAHTHPVTGQVNVQIKVSGSDGGEGTGADAVLGKPTDSIGADVKPYYKEPATGDPNPGGNLGGVSATHTLATGSTGQGTPFNLSVPRHPYLTIRYLIAVRNADYPVKDDEVSDQ